MKRKLRYFAGANNDRLSGELNSFIQSINTDLQGQNSILRSRARDLCQNNDYARKFLQMVKANVVGSTGIILQSQATNKRTRQIIETAFKEWSGVDCTMSGKLTFLDLQRLVIEMVARDGEAFIQITDDGKYSLKLHAFEADHINEKLNMTLKNGNRVVMGIELNEWDKPIAYYLKKKHPAESHFNYTLENHTRVPADEIIHLYLMDRPNQVRGYTWLHTAIKRLAMLGGYEEAELVSARVSASKMGFYTSPAGDYYQDDDENSENDLLTEAEPGVFEELPEGVSFQTFDPQHPTSAYDSFIKSTLRGISSGLNVAYNSLANDLEGVNFSSIRSGVLEEREQWRVIQNWLIDHFHKRIFQLFIERNEIIGKNASKAKFLPRGWSWVDPKKDIEASILGVQLGITTRQDVATAQGKDLEDIFQQLANEQELMKSYGLNIGVENGQAEDNDGNAQETD